MRTYFHIHKKFKIVVILALSAICLSIAVLCAQKFFVKSRLSLADAVKTNIYNEASGFSKALSEEDWDSAGELLLASVDSMYSSSAPTLPVEQRARIKDLFVELVTSLNDYEMIAYDADGALTELSKSYLANAASYAVTSIAGTGHIPRSQTALSEFISTNSIDLAVKKLESSYAETARQLGDPDSQLNLEDMQAQMNALKAGLADHNDDKINLGKLALRVAALETMVTTLKNSSITDDAGGELAAGHGQADKDTTIANLKKEISNREASIAALQAELDAMAQPGGKITSSLQSSVSGVSAGLSDLQTSAEREGSTLKLSTANSLAATDQDTAQAGSTVSGQLSDLKKQIYDKIRSVNAALSSKLNEEMVARAVSDAAIQEQIRSSADTSLEKQADAIEGISVFAKLGALFKKLIALNTYIDSSVENESRARNNATRELQSHINARVEEVYLAMNHLQSELTNTDSDNTYAILTAKKDLELALADLDTSLSGKLSEQGNATQEQISSVLQTVTQLQESLQTADSGLAADLENARNSLSKQLETAKTQLNGKISLLDAVLNDAISAEEKARQASDAAIQDQIHSSEGTELEQDANGLEGETIFAKLGSLLRKIISLGQHVDSSIASEAAARQLSVEALQNEIDKKISNVNDAMAHLQEELTAADAKNAAAITEAKNGLELALDDLNTTLSADISALDTDTKATISDIRQTISTLQTTLQEADADLASDLENARTTLLGQINTTKSTLDTQIRTLDQSMSDAIVTLRTHVDDSISAERTARKQAIEELHDDLTANIGDVNTSIRNLQTELNKANDNNTDEIKKAKDDLENALDDLETSISGDISALDSKTQADISDILSTIASLQTNLEDADAALAQNLESARSILNGQITSAKNTLTGQISSLDQYLNDSISAEEQSRKQADQALKNQLYSEDYTDLEQKANEISGTTVFEKLGTILNHIHALKKTDEWVQNVTLCHTAASGTKMFGILNSSDSAHAGWKMWKLDGASLGVTFHAEDTDTPESEIHIMYAGNPVMIMEYQVREGYLIIYTPTTPQEDIIIRNIHVQNQAESF